MGNQRLDIDTFTFCVLKTYTIPPSLLKINYRNITYVFSAVDFVFRWVVYSMAASINRSHAQKLQIQAASVSQSDLPS